MDDIDKIAAPAVKLATVWGLFGFSSLAEAASFATMCAGFLAAFYSLLLVTEWFWKKLWKPLFIRYSLFGFKRRIMTLAEDAAEEAAK